MTRNVYPVCLFSFILLCFCSNVHAIRDETNQKRWDKPHDNPAAIDKEVPGFLVNMGPTGARGILTKNSFIIKYIFPSSPASAVLRIDDEVLGANNKVFSSHTFGGGSNGIEGPIQDLGLAIEDSEGTDGKLRLSVLRDGKKIPIVVQLEKLGRFADTFPFNCAKTEILKERAYKWLMKSPGEGLQSQGRCIETLAMLSSDDPKVLEAGEKLALEWNQAPDPNSWTWHLGFQGIVLSEYYLLTKDKSVLKTLGEVMDLLRADQWKIPSHREKIDRTKYDFDEEAWARHAALYEGGFGHTPFIDAAGSNGYGPMQRPTMLAIMTWQLGKQCGIEVKHEGPEKAFQFLEYGTTESGSVAYGGEFTLNAGLVDPVEWKKDTRNASSHKSGMAYLAYMLTPERADSKEMMKLHLKNIGACYRDMADGHACPLIGLAWGWVGVFASDDRKLKKEVFDYYKAWLNMSRCDGSDSYVMLPGRNYADDSYYCDPLRNHMTATVAMLYSFSTPKLRVQGVTPDQKQATNKKSDGSFSKKAGSVPVKIKKPIAGSVESIDMKIISKLVSLTESGGLPSSPIRISKSSAAVALSKVSKDGVVTFSAGGKYADFAFTDLTLPDRATVTLALVQAEQENKALFGIVGFYLDCAGQPAQAQQFYEQAGADIVDKLKTLFEPENNN